MSFGLRRARVEVVGSTSVVILFAKQDITGTVSLLSSTSLHTSRCHHFFSGRF